MRIKSMVVIIICIVAVNSTFGEAKQPQTVKEVHVLEIPSEETMPEATQDDIQGEEYCDSLDMLASCVEAEAGNQDKFGKRLVVDVILNRVESDEFPDDIESVITQKGQFAVHENGSMYRTVPSEETYEAVREELEQRTDTKILFFSAHKYNSCCTPAYRHQDHYFGY
jgi:N-acetylmuramoyl-L-alanine amidase